MDVFNGQSYRCILSFENRGVVCACKFNRKDQNPGLFGLKFSVCVSLKHNRVVLVVLCVRYRCRTIPQQAGRAGM